MNPVHLLYLRNCCFFFFVFVYFKRTVPRNVAIIMVKNLPKEKSIIFECLENFKYTRHRYRYRYNNIIIAQKTAFQLAQTDWNFMPSKVFTIFIWKSNILSQISSYYFSMSQKKKKHSKKINSIEKCG